MTIAMTPAFGSAGVGAARLMQLIVASVSRVMSFMVIIIEVIAGFVINKYLKEYSYLERSSYCFEVRYGSIYTQAC
jgi:hypothetical protein